MADSALLNGISAVIGSIVGAGALWRASRSDSRTETANHIASLYAENRLLRTEVADERRSRAEFEAQMRSDFRALEGKLDACNEEKHAMALTIARLQSNGGR